MKWHLFIPPYLLCFALIRWGASQVQIFFWQWANLIASLQKNETMEAPQNRRFSFEVWSSFPLAQLYGWTADNICQSMHGKVTIYCPSGNWTVHSPHQTQLAKKIPFLSSPSTPLHSTPPTRQKGRPLHCMTRLLMLHGNSIPKIGCHYFWPGRIAFPKNTLPIVGTTGRG